MSVEKQTAHPSTTRQPAEVSMEGWEQSTTTATQQDNQLKDKLKHWQDSCAETHSARVMEENTQVRYTAFIINTVSIIIITDKKKESLKIHRWNMFNGF